MARIARRSLVAGIASGVALPGILRAQAAPPIRIVVPAARGEPLDSLARLLADRLIPFLGRGMVVEAQIGAGGLTAAEALATAPPDDTVIGILGAATLCAAPAVYGRVDFDPLRALRPVTQVTETAVVLAVESAQARARGWADLPTLLAWAKAHPGALAIAHAGVGTESHLALVALADAAEVAIAEGPARDGTAADLVAGVVDGAADLPGAVLPAIAAGRARPVGVSSRRRLSLLPDVPAFAEYPGVGLGAIDLRGWNMVVVPATMPDPDVQRLSVAIRRVASHPEFAPVLRRPGYAVALSVSPEAAAQMIAEEAPKWQRLAELSGAAAN